MELRPDVIFEILHVKAVLAVYTLGLISGYAAWAMVGRAGKG